MVLRQAPPPDQWASRHLSCTQDPPRLALSSVVCTCVHLWRGEACLPLVLSSCVSTRGAPVHTPECLSVHIYASD